MCTADSGGSCFGRPQYDTYGEGIIITGHNELQYYLSLMNQQLPIHIQGVDVANFEARMQAMTKPTYTAIVQHAKVGKPALVFVPTRKHARVTAVDLVTYSMAESGERSFLQCTKNDLAPFLAKIKDQTLIHTLSHGVGYLHEGLSPQLQEVAAELFNVGAIHVCVANSSMCWGMTMTGHLVVVMGTQYYDGRENAHTDYQITDLLQMMGRASRPQIDSSGKCVILCHAPQKEYYKKFLYELFPG